VARVALVCEPPDGGVAEHVEQLAAGLPAHGHEAVLFAAPGSPVASRRAAAGGAVRALPFVRDYRHPQRDAAAAWRLAKALRGGFDLVHAHAAKAGVVGRLAGALTGTPSLYTPHCFPFVGDVGAARRRFGLVVERGLARVSAGIVCVCEEERGVARAHGIRPRGALSVILNGAPACPDPPPDPALTAMRAEGPLVGAVTVLRPQKALETLLEAVPRLLAAVPDARVAIVGDGPDAERLHARARALGLADDARLAFLPFAPPAARHLRALDVYVLPSAWEAFPIAVLEALACGVPQVVTDVGGSREAVTPETGVLVPARDPGALADALAALLRDPERRAAMARASVARHAERFTVERMVRETAALYDEVLRPRRGR
jgi:glycosyltransferase involved in cell wall biosynthesis